MNPEHGRFGRRIQGQDRWRMRAQFKSPAYTTRWSDLVLVKV